MEERVELLRDTYEPEKHGDEVMEAFSRISKKFPKEVRKDIKQSFRQHKYDMFVELLLTHYYDPLYQRSLDKDEKEVNEIEFTNIEEGRELIKSYVNEIE